MDSHDSLDSPRVLHLFGDWKWTGPAEPVVDLCAELQRQGCRVRLACPPSPPDAGRSVAHEAARRGVPVITDFSLRRLSSVWSNVADTARLSRLLGAEPVDILHVHFTHDHVVGLLAASCSSRRPRLVRSNHTGRPIGAHLLNRLLYREGTDAALTFSEQAYRQDSAWFHSAPRMFCLDPAMPVDRYRSSADPREVRRRFSIGPEDVVLGVVARMQRHRRFEILLQGFARALKERPRLKLVIVGRGTHWEEVARVPTLALGIEKSVVFTGYLKEDYLDIVSIFDALVFLVPGSDGTCRALREAMAMGKPAIGSRRGMIPEIVDHGHTGLVVDDEPEPLAQAMVELADNAPRRKEMGARAREKAMTRYRVEDQAAKILAVYRSLIGG